MKMSKKKKFKGMTLVEILVALAIFAMLGALLVLAGVQIDKTMQSSNKFKKKMVVEAPYAANQLEKHMVNGTEVSMATQPLTISVQLGAASIDVQGYRYDTDEIIKSTMDATQQANYNKTPNSRLNFKYVKVDRNPIGTTGTT